MIDNRLKNKRLKVLAEQSASPQKEKNTTKGSGMKTGRGAKVGDKAGNNLGDRSRRKPGEKTGGNAGKKAGEWAEDKASKRMGGNAGEKAGRKPSSRTGERTDKKPGEWTGKNSSKSQVGKAGENPKWRRNQQEPERQPARKNNSQCPVFLRCGGCQLLDMPYDKQLKMKQEKLEELLKPYCKVRGLIGMKEPYHYRNKVHAVFDHDKKGNPISGVYEANSHRVVPVESCLIEDQKADEIIGTIRGMLKSFKIKTYDEDTGYGLLRHVLIRRGFSTGEIMVVLVTVSPIFPSKNNFVRALREKHPEITTIVQNINGRDTSMVLGDKENVLYGKGYIEDILCGFRFRISSKSFYQVNPVQTEVLYQKAMELAGLTGKETVIDAYCGIGTIGIVASKKAGKVIGVELNRDAVRDAAQNAKINSIKNVQFYCNDAGAFMSEMAVQGETADVVFMDPPRSGSTEEFIQAVAKMKPKKVVYVSCGPDTLVRDLAVFERKGYKAMEAWGVDMFAHSLHCEVCVKLVRVGK